MTERSSVVLVAGVSFGADSETRHAFAKNGFDVLTPRWSGWALAHLAAGKLRVDPLITRRIGLDGVPELSPDWPTQRWTPRSSSLPQPATRGLT